MKKCELTPGCEQGFEHRGLCLVVSLAEPKPDTPWCFSCGGMKFINDQCMDCGRPYFCTHPDCTCQPDVGCRA